MTSVEVMETTAGMTRAATSANEGMVTEVTGPAVVWIGDDCAFEFFIMPRSALRTMPNATEAMMIAIVDKMRLVDGFIEGLLLLDLPCYLLETPAAPSPGREPRIVYPRAVRVPALSCDE